ncbi:MAG: histidine--tRNA ligase [Planctomycetota bacterium]|jgi:histidyl-tRNA synthetase
MKIPPVKGTRDFYPPQMAVRNFIVDGWKEASLRNGFEEYDGPIFEYLKMFQIKSGDEIVEQLFSLQDRGGRDLALRPEITPTLARMVNQQINSLPKPIKWFSLPRLFRAERPQKGRLREFFQWNVDIIGENDVRADADVIFTTVDYLRATGLGPDDIVVKISSRKMLAAVLENIGVPAEKLDALYVVLDKKNKLPGEAFEQMLNDLLDDSQQVAKVRAFMELENMQQVEDMFASHEAFDELKTLLGWLDRMGVGDYCKFDPAIVRGLAYYTGIVYEIYDRASELRAICGGGRYDNLLRDFGGPAISATGMGMGDCVLEILLREKGLLDANLPNRRLDFFICCLPPTTLSAGECEAEPMEVAVELAAELRKRDFFVDLGYKVGKLKKLLKQASDRNADKCIIIGEEFKEKKLAVKDMATGQQELVGMDEFLTRLGSA